jgi:hypothetical protein
VRAVSLYNGRRSVALRLLMAAHATIERYYCCALNTVIGGHGSPDVGDGVNRKNEYTFNIYDNSRYLISIGKQPVRDEYSILFYFFIE